MAAAKTRRQRQAPFHGDSIHPPGDSAPAKGAIRIDAALTCLGCDDMLLVIRDFAVKTAGGRE